MRLKSLQIQGFKSFPDKTTISFDNGITAIVGPNGSGKSNITDAIRWVLGEMSSKTLRGNKMEDVIFDGAHSRSAMGFAEVSLTLDNSDGSLPIDFSEVTVSRRYYRSGDSEYLINKNPVRLKDINELFMDTGLGRDGYSIIGQGKIADIISVKSDERRQVFEEAAGISKFRYRKAESEKRLEQTQENLLRLLDILSELEGRVGPLAEQAEKARQYLELREERKQLEISLWMNEIDDIRSNRQKLEEDCQRAHKQLEENEAQSSAAEAEIEKKYLETQQLMLRIEELRSDIAAVNEQIQNKQSEISLIKNDILHNEEMIERLNSDIADDTDKAKELDNAVAEKEAEIEGLDNAIKLLQEQLDSVSEESARIVAQLAGSDSELNRINSDIVEKTAVLTDSKIKIGYLESKAEVLQQDIARLDEQRQTSEFIVSKIKEEKAVLSEQQEDIEDEKLSCENIISGYKLRMDVAKEKIDKQTALRDSLQKEIERRTWSINTLSDMQKHFSGYYDSVKSVMQAKDRGMLKGIHGPVSSLINVNEKFALAIETALGNQVQNIVVDTDDNAKSAIYYLKNNKAGRATFLPLGTIKGNVVSGSEFKGGGFVGVASEMVECDKKYRSVVDYMLGKVCIADNIDNAVIIAKKAGHKYRVVTLDGQVVNAGGSLTGGSAAVKGSGLLNRQNEIDKQKKELEKNESEFEKIDSILKELSDKYSTDVAYIDGVYAQVKELNDQLSMVKMRLDDAVFRLNNENEALERINLQIADNNAQGKADEEEKAKLNSDIVVIEKEIEELTLKAQEVSQGQENIVGLRTEMAEKMGNIKLEIMAKEKDIEAARQYVSQMLLYKEERDTAATSRLEEISELQANNEELNIKINGCEEEISKLESSCGDTNNEISSTISQRDEAEKAVNEMRNEVKNIQSLREGLIREAERLDSRREAVETKYNAIVMKLFDEYELTLTDAQALRIAIANIQEANQRLNTLKGRLKRLGDVNVGAIDEYKAVKERYEFLSGQVNDLQKAKADIENVIADLTQRMKTIFSERFKIINERFKETFVELFEGGSAELTLSDPTDVLGSGIEIKVSPPGKVIKNLSALSGGEQAFVAIALYFAILKVRPTPFCVMDEIEAALDEVNTVKFADYMRRITGKTQFVVVTHRRGTMEGADILYGVTMQEEGVSKILTINVNEVSEKLNIG